jgi:hypothetical protein
VLSNIKQYLFERAQVLSLEYPSLEELYQTESVDGIRLMDKWDGIETIIADGTYDSPIQEELDSFKVFRDIH